jgi:hypothetical protein
MQVGAGSSKITGLLFDSVMSRVACTALEEVLPHVLPHLDGFFFLAAGCLHNLPPFQRRLRRSTRANADTPAICIRASRMVIGQVAQSIVGIVRITVFSAAAAMTGNVRASMLPASRLSRTTARSAVLREESASARRCRTMSCDTGGCNQPRCTIPRLEREHVPQAEGHRRQFP